MRKIGFVAGMFFVFMGLIAFAQETKGQESKAEEGILLKYKFAKGDVRNYKTKQISKVEVMEQETTDDEETTYTETVNNVQDGVATIKLEQKSIKAILTMEGKTTSFDSTKKEDMEKVEDNSMAAIVAKTLNKSVIYKEKENGEIMEVDLKAVKEALEGTPVGDMFAKSMESWIKNSYMIFPSKKIIEGDRWQHFMKMFVTNVGEMKFTFTCEYKGIEDLEGENCAKVGLAINKIEMLGGNSPFQIEGGEGAVTVYLSLDKGIQKKLEMKMTYNLKCGSGKNTMTMHLKSSAEITLIK